MSQYDTYTIFALTPDGEALWGGRVTGQNLVELIDECLTDERVTYVEVHDGSCDPRIESKQEGRLRAAFQNIRTSPTYITISHKNMPMSCHFEAFPDWGTPLLSSDGSGKVSNGPGKASNTPMSSRDKRLGCWRAAVGRYCRSRTSLASLPRCSATGAIAAKGGMRGRRGTRYWRRPHSVVCTTDSKHPLPVAENLLEQNRSVRQACDRA